MNTELTNKVVKCRKVHQCDWCAERIQKDEKAHYRTGVQEGVFFTSYQHFECYDAMMRSEMDEDGYMTLGQLRGKTIEESY